MKLLITSLIAAATLNSPTSIPKDDVVFRALNDELHRSATRLHLDKYEKPYFISYCIHQTERLAIAASFGAIDSCHQSISRNLSVDVRQGDYSLDSSRGVGDGGIFAILSSMGVRNSSGITVDDNYDSIQHEVWLRTDEAYKRAIEDLASKKAFLQENDVKELPNSMSKETPVVSIEPVAHLDDDTEKCKGMIRKLSAVFRQYPRVQKSVVTLEDKATTRWFVNSEGFANRTPKTECHLAAIASTQAADGTAISDMELIVADKEAALPPYEEIEKRLRRLAERMTKLADAKQVEQYRGPILFEGTAAAEFFAQSLQPYLGHAPEHLGKQNGIGAATKNPLENRLETRILPTFISVVDDPATKHFGTSKIASSYTIDDDGLRAQKIQLVNKGILKSFAMSRVPSRDIKQSNGHAFGDSGVASNLYIVSDNKLTPAQLREKLISLAKEDGLKEVLIVRHLWNFFSASLEPQAFMPNLASGFGFGGDVKLSPPVALYKVSVADGHEELVRGSQFGNLTMRVLRDIVATGDDPRAYPLLSIGHTLRSGGSGDVTTIVTPSILIGEIELAEPTKQSEHPPILPNPYFDKQ